MDGRGRPSERLAQLLFPAAPFAFAASRLPFLVGLPQATGGKKEGLVVPAHTSSWRNGLVNFPLLKVQKKKKHSEKNCRKDESKCPSMNQSFLRDGNRIISAMLANNFRTFLAKLSMLFFFLLNCCDSIQIKCCHSLLSNN